MGNQQETYQQNDGEITANEDSFRIPSDQEAVGVAYVSPDGRWLRVNETLCQLVGYTTEELTARRIHDITHPDDLANSLAFMRRVLLGESPAFSMEKRYIHKDGTPVWVQLTMSLMRDALGKPKYFVAVVRDIHESKREEAIRHAREERLREAVDQAQAVGDAFATQIHAATLEGILDNLCGYFEKRSKEESSSHSRGQRASMNTGSS